MLNFVAHRKGASRHTSGTVETLKLLEWTLQPLLQNLQHLISSLQLLGLLQHLTWMDPDSHQTCWHLLRNTWAAQADTHEDPGERALPGIRCFLYWNT